MRVALLHGFAHTPASWREVLAALPPDLDARAVVTPGHDPSAPVAPTWDQTIDHLAAAIRGTTIVVGYSFGARLALGLLAREAIAGTILIGVHPGLADDAARGERRAADAAWAARLRAEGTAAFLTAWELQPTFATQTRAPLAVRDRRRVERGSLEPHALAAALDVLGLGAMPDLRETLVSRHRCAHLIVGGDDDKFLAVARTLQHVAPALPIDVVDGSGHDPTLEAPAALAATLVRAVARLSMLC